MEEEKKEAFLLMFFSRLFASLETFPWTSTETLLCLQELLSLPMQTRVKLTGLDVGVAILHMVDAHVTCIGCVRTLELYGQVLQQEKTNA